MSPAALLLLAACAAPAAGAVQSVPWPSRGWLYWQRLEPGEAGPSIWRQRPGPGGAMQRVLSPGNRAVVDWRPSDDAALVAYLVRPAGGGPAALRVRDLSRDEDLADTVAPVGSFAWAADGRTLFYVALDGTGRGHRLWRHRLGEDPERDVLVHDEVDPGFHLTVRRSRSGAFVMLSIDGREAGELRTIPASHPRQAPQLVLERKRGRRVAAEHRAEFFLLRLDDEGPGFRLVAVPTGDPQPRRWVELVPHRPGVTVEEVVALRRFAVARLRENERTRLVLLDPRTGQPAELGVPEAAGEILPARNDDYESLAFRYATRAPDGQVTIREWDAVTRTHREVGGEPAPFAPR